MKRLLILLSSLIMAVGILSAQTVPVVISGTVADVDGNGIDNLTVDIYSDSTFNFNYNNQVLTNANGYFADTIDYPMNFGFGVFLVSTTNCDGSPLTDLVFVENFEPVFQDVDLIYCDTVGGWPPIDSCFAQVTCDPDGNLVAAAFGTAPFSYLWSTGETTEVIMPQDTGYFCVTITDADGCVAEGCSHYVGGSIFNDSCDVWIVPIANGELFADGFGTALPLDFLWSTGETTQSIIVSNSMEYCVTMTDGNGCSSFACYDVTVDTFLCSVTIEQIGDDLFANSGNAAVVYEWSTGETTQTITPTFTGLYCVNIFDLDGCFAQTCYYYSGGMPGDTTCSANVEFIEDLGGYFVAASGTEPFTYLWDDGSTDPFLFTLDAAIHCVTIVDANGCVAEACSGQAPPLVTENDISGYIYSPDSTQLPVFVTGLVSLIDATTGSTVITTDIVNLNGFPFYNFTDVADGEYIVRAEAIKPDGSTFIPTYHFATSLSSEADKITIPYSNAAGVWNSFDVLIFDIIRKPGQGSIAGNVTKVPGFGGTVDNGRLTLDGISILLFDENREPIQYVKTNDSGEFSFPSLAWGTYHVYIDVPGHENAFFTVILGPNTPEVNDLNFNIYEGNITTSNGTSNVENLEYVSNVKLFPNPTSGSTTIEVTATESGNVNLSIFDVSGKILQTQSLNISKATQRFEINLENLDSGLYFVRLVDGNQSVTKRLIINK